MLNGYSLLKGYLIEARSFSKAYSYSEKYHKKIYKYLNYPLIVLTSTSAILAGFNKYNYAIMSISFLSTLLIGFDRVIDPNKKSHEAHTISIEFSEIANNIQNFIYINNRTQDEIKEYSKLIHSQLTIWRSLAPEIKSEFVRNASIDCEMKIRTSMSSKKKHHQNTLAPEETELVIQKIV